MGPRQDGTPSTSLCIVITCTHRSFTSHTPLTRKTLKNMILQRNYLLTGKVNLGYTRDTYAWEYFSHYLSRAKVTKCPYIPISRPSNLHSLTYPTANWVWLQKYYHSLFSSLTTRRPKAGEESRVPLSLPLIAGKIPSTKILASKASPPLSLVGKMARSSPLSLKVP